MRDRLRVEIFGWIRVLKLDLIMRIRYRPFMITLFAELIDLPWWLLLSCMHDLRIFKNCKQIGIHFPLPVLTYLRRCPCWAVFLWSLWIPILNRDVNLGLVHRIRSIRGIEVGRMEINEAWNIGITRVESHYLLVYRIKTDSLLLILLYS